MGAIISTYEQRQSQLVFRDVIYVFNRTVFEGKKFANIIEKVASFVRRKNLEPGMKISLINIFRSVPFLNQLAHPALDFSTPSPQLGLCREDIVTVLEKHPDRG
jgi:hypothetical protein